MCIESYIIDARNLRRELLGSKKEESFNVKWPKCKCSLSMLIFCIFTTSKPTTQKVQVCFGVE